MTETEDDYTTDTPSESSSEDSIQVSLTSSDSNDNRSIAVFSSSTDAIDDDVNDDDAYDLESNEEESSTYYSTDSFSENSSKNSQRLSKKNSGSIISSSDSELKAECTGTCGRLHKVPKNTVIISNKAKQRDPSLTGTIKKDKQHIPRTKQIKRRKSTKKKSDLNKIASQIQKIDKHSQENSSNSLRTKMKTSRKVENEENANTKAGEKEIIDSSLMDSSSKNSKQKKRKLMQAATDCELQEASGNGQNNLIGNNNTTDMEKQTAFQTRPIKAEKDDTEFESNFHGQGQECVEARATEQLLVAASAKPDSENVVLKRSEVHQDQMPDVPHEIETCSANSVPHNVFDDIIERVRKRIRSVI